MTKIRRSALFKRQLIEITKGYRHWAGSGVALQFVHEIERSISFIAKQPNACAVYTRLEGKEFRKWRVDNFPVSVFFRAEAETVIVLEALYAHRMDIASRFPKDIE